jgi:predicted permease
MRRLPMKSGLSWMDVKLGLRMLVKHPTLTVVGGLGMAVAIAIATTSFALFDSYIFPTIPLDEGDRVVGIENWDIAIRNQEHRSLHDFATWRRELTGLQDIGAFTTVRRNLVRPGAAAEPVSIAEITATGFTLPRVPPLMGRPIQEADERKGALPVVVIGYDAWRTYFASDPGILGRGVRMGDAVHTIVGVMPDGFAFPVNHSFWRALQADPADYARRRGPGITMFARLAPGVPLERAQAELTALGQRAAEAFPDTNARLTPRIVRYAKFFADDAEPRVMTQVQVLITLLLVVVGVNVAIVVYARTATRHNEIVVRTALGASRTRIVTQLFVEALVLAAVSAVAGLAITEKALDVLDSLLTQWSERGGEFAGVPFWMQNHLSWRTVTYVVGLTILAAAISGALPAIKATGRRMQASLRDMGGTTKLQLGRVWTGLIVAQVAFAVALLPSAVAFTWFSIEYANADPGFAAEEFLTARVLMDSESVPTDRAEAYARDFETRYAARLRGIAQRTAEEPGVSHVTLMSVKPGVEATARIAVEGNPAFETGTARNSVRTARVDAAFFDAFDVPLLAGRRFTPADADGGDPVLVSGSLVRRFFGEAGGALGRRIRYLEEMGPDGAPGPPPRWHEIVGVVGELPVHPIYPGDDEGRVYHPWRAADAYPTTIAMRVRAGDPAALGPRLREIATTLDPAVRMDGIRTLDGVYRDEQLGLHAISLSVGLISLSVVLLSSAGIYALMSLTVTRRRREIGIRAALGAEPRRVLGAILVRALLQLSAGVVLGLVACILMDRATDGEMMFGREAVILPLVSAIMLGVGLAAAIGPARRGLRIQPTEALREE